MNNNTLILALWCSNSVLRMIDDSVKIDYKNMAFVLIKPPARVISTHIIKNKKAHTELLDRAKEKGYCLYYAPVTRKDGRHVAKMPWILDRDSLNHQPKSEPEPKSEPVQDKPNALYCPYCDAEIKSTPGRTLHVKSKHPEKIEEYQKWLKSLGKK
jgi:hypothetical protein